MSSTLIIGGGLAGLFTALKLAPAPCLVIAPKPLGQGASSAWAQGGVSAAIQPGDSIDSHVADTVKAGAGLVNEAVTRGMAGEASDRIHDLVEYGVPFDRDLAGHLVASREAAHSHARVVRVKGDMAGAKIMEALIAAVRHAPSIHVLDGAEALNLVIENGRIAGANILLDGKVMRARAGQVVLATGGIGHLYAVTTNPPQARGQGLGMAALAGAVVRDPEFVQFHPTALNVGRDPSPLLTEALRGEGAILVNGAGERFMTALHPDAELAPRDVVARGVFAEIKAARGAFLDARFAVGSAFAEKFPTVYAAAMSAGIDPVHDLLPVCPAQHYHMGGVLTDARGQTSIPGLYAVGEVASSGVHGANRLASNSLLEAVVFAARIAEQLRPVTNRAVTLLPDASPVLPHEDHGGIEPLRAFMMLHVGVTRGEKELAETLRLIRRMQLPERLEPSIRNALVAAELIVTGALLRHESRGGHARYDYPDTDAVARHTIFTLAEARRSADTALARL
ncbi:MAG TPA: L-aspartate oxidase [Beijerinckiaceae bacterium]|nr:L-aspartate oxidase [Beijerinckiaceae bacterium]